MEVFDSHGSMIYADPYMINLEPVVSALRQYGINKSLDGVTRLFRRLSNEGVPGIYSLRTARIRSLWPIIYGLKTFLQDKDLVKEPVDFQDEFYHIPALEYEYLTMDKLSRLLGRYQDEELVTYGLEAFTKGGNIRIRHAFGVSMLSIMLARDVWERITRRYRCRDHITLLITSEDPPTAIFSRPPLRSACIRQRVTLVTLHCFWEKFNAQIGTMASGFTLRDFCTEEVLLDVWYDATAQLLADGVPLRFSRQV